MVGGEEVAAQVRAGGEVHTGRHLPDRRGRHPHHLGEAADAHLGDDPVGGLQVIGVGLDDGPGHVHARDVRQTRLLLVQPLRLQCIRILHTGVVRAHEDMPGLVPGPGNLVQGQDVAQRNRRGNRFAPVIETGVAVTTDGADHIAHSSTLAARGKRPRCIRAALHPARTALFHGAALLRGHVYPNRLPRRALPGRRLAGLGATRGCTTGLPRGQARGSPPPTGPSVPAPAGAAPPCRRVSAALRVSL